MFDFLSGVLPEPVPEAVQAQVQQAKAERPDCPISEEISSACHADSSTGHGMQCSTSHRWYRLCPGQRPVQVAAFTRGPGSDSDAAQASPGSVAVGSGQTSQGADMQPRHDPVRAFFQDAQSRMDGMQQGAWAPPDHTELRDAFQRLQRMFPGPMDNSVSPAPAPAHGHRAAGPAAAAAAAPGAGPALHPGEHGTLQQLPWAGDASARSKLTQWVDTRAGPAGRSDSSTAL